LEGLLSKQATEGGYFVSWLHLHHAYALSISTQGGDVIEGGSYYYTFGGYEHKPLMGMNNGCAYNLACFGYDFESPYSTTSARLKGVSIKLSALAEPVGADCK
jgi:hypothetical protein